MSASVWALETADGPTFPRLDGDRTVDIAIVGGGFTGISAAYYLREKNPDLRIALLEADTLGSGASGRNGGLMLNFIPGLDASPEVAAGHYAITREAIDDITALCKTHGFPEAVSRRGSLRVMTTRQSGDAARERVRALRAAGAPLEFLEGDTLRRRLGVTWSFGAVFDPNAGRLNGLGFVRGLARVLSPEGVSIFEQTRVTAIDEGKTIRLKTAHGTVTAKAIVLGTNAYTPALGYFQSGIIPLHSLVLATHPLGAGDLFKVGWGDIDGWSDDRPRLSYSSLSPSGRMVFGGGSNAAYCYRLGGDAFGDIALEDRRFRAVERQISTFLPGAAEFAFPVRWSGPLALTMSRVCSIGVTGAHKNVYYGLGYSGCGITLANLAGRIIADIHAGTALRWQSLPIYCRALEYAPPEPFRLIGYYAYIAFTGRSPKKVFRSGAR